MTLSPYFYLSLSLSVFLSPYMYLSYSLSPSLSVYLIVPPSISLALEHSLSLSLCLSVSLSSYSLWSHTFWSHTLIHHKYFYSLKGGWWIATAQSISDLSWNRTRQCARVRSARDALRPSGSSTEWQGEISFLLFFLIFVSFFSFRKYDNLSIEFQGEIKQSFYLDSYLHN